MQKEKSINHSILACSLILLQCTLYGLGDPLSKMAYTHVNAYSVLSFRYTFALLAMWILFGKKLLSGLKESPFKLIVIPCICVAGSHLFSNLALQYTQATSVGFLRSLSVVITPILAMIFYKKKIRPFEILVLIGAVVGLYLLCGYGKMSGFGLGELLALGCALLSAGGVISLKRSLQQVNPLVMTMFQTATSALFAIICAFVWDHGISMTGAVPSVWISIIYLALGCTLGGYMLQNTAIRMISPNTVSFLMCFCSVMTAFFSYFLLGERLSITGLIGAMMILISVITETLLSGKLEKNTASSGTQSEISGRGDSPV